MIKQKSLDFNGKTNHGDKTMMNFKLRFKNAKLLGTYFNAFYVIIDEIQFQAKPEGLVLRDLDPSRVAMFDAEFPKEMFEEYQCDQPTEFTISLQTFAKIMKLAGENESVEIVLNPTEKKLVVAFQGTSMRKFTLPTLEDERSKTPLPKITFYAKAILPTKQFLQFMQNIQSLSDHFRLIANSDQMLVTGEGDKTTAEITMVKKDLALLECKDTQKAIYSLSYMEEAIKALADVCITVTVEWCSDMPIKTNFQLSHPGKIVWYLAPRIKTE